MHQAKSAGLWSIEFETQGCTLPQTVSRYWIRRLHQRIWKRIVRRNVCALSKSLFYQKILRRFWLCCMVQSNLNRNLSRKEPGITRKGGILPCSFPAGFGAPHAPTIMHLKKTVPLWRLWHEKTMAWNRLMPTEKPPPPLHRSLAFIVLAEHIRFACCGRYRTRTKISKGRVSLW